MSKLMSSSHVVKVGIADLKVTKAPNTIRTSGLGSCVGVVIYDERKKVAGLAHVLLPDSKLARQNNFNHYKYADTAIPLLVEQLSSLGARSNLLKAKVAGGAQMFQFSSGSDMMRIGPRNVESVLEKLKQLSIPVLASDTGGNAGRTIEFDLQTSLLKVRTVNKGETFI